jgi:hypothetical protein
MTGLSILDPNILTTAVFAGKSERQPNSFRLVEIRDSLFWGLYYCCVRPVSLKLVSLGGQLIGNTTYLCR